MEEKNILSSIIDYLKPKRAHDAIDRVTNAWKQSQQQKSNGFSDRLHIGRPPKQY